MIKYKVKNFKKQGENMAYRYDKDLEFLKELSSPELD
ncbi:DUF3944 domain-containing protein [Campylobacter jejuni]|nr:DUF3944 domain-containing protein [Campylobacter jejuni]